MLVRSLVANCIRIDSTSGFVIVFSTFLFSCVDYSKFPSDGHGMLRDVIVPHCSSRLVHDSGPHSAMR